MFSFFRKKEEEKNKVVDINDDQIAAIADGNMISIETVSDPVFATKMMGDGVAFELDENTIYAPCNGTLSALYPTGHAFGITRNDGVEVLVHIGINTVQNNGDGFTILAKQGDTIKAGEAIVKVDLKKLKAKYDMTVMLIITDPNDKEITFKDYGKVLAGEVISQ